MKALARCLIILAIPFGLYWSTIHGAFHYDDFHHIVENKSIRNLGNLAELFLDPATFSSQRGARMYRPVLMTSYAVNYSLGELNPDGWHLFNILLHGLNTLLLFGIARKFLRHPGPALLVALIFVIHPVGGESINYISSRSSLLMATFFLAAFLAYQHGVEQERIRRWPWLVLANILYVLALFTKESAVVLPLVILVYEFLFLRGPESERKMPGGVSRRLLPLILLTIGYLILRQLMLGVILSPVQTRPVWINLLTEIKAYFFYIRLMLWPVGLSVDHSFRIETSITGPRVLLALSGLILLLSLGLFLARSKESGNRVLSLCLVWYFLTLVPTSSIVPLNMLVNERRLYLPLAAFALALGTAYLKIKPRAPRTSLGVLLFTALSFSSLVIARNPVWNQEVSLWRDAYRKAPDNPRPARGLADCYFFDNQLERSLGLYRKASLLEPDSARIHHNIGVTLDLLGQAESALHELKLAYDLFPDDVWINFSLGNVYEQVGSFELARFHLEKAVALDPNHAMAHNNLGRIYFVQGNWDAAEYEYRLALGLEPEHEFANYNLGLLLYHRRRAEEALPHLRAAFQANPSFPDNAFRLGLCLLRLRQWAQAREAFLKAVELNPAMTQAWYNLGLVERTLGNAEAADEAFRRAGKNPLQPPHEKP